MLFIQKWPWDPNSDFWRLQKHLCNNPALSRLVHPYIKDHVIIYTRILRNINLQNLKRASAFIDIMDRHVDQEAQDFLTFYRDVLAKNKMLNNKGIYKRYEIEWIGRCLLYTSDAADE